MRAVIFGGAGLIGQAIARLVCAGAGPVTSLVLADRATPVLPAGPVPVTAATGDITDGGFVAELLAGADCVFHLAALLAAETEADARRGAAVNLHALMAMLEGSGAQDRVLRFVFASSIAAFGGALPDVVDDSVPRTPQTSYGTHKAIAELLIDDATRRGRLDGRVLRLPVVLTRNAPAGTAVSDRVAALVRGPVLGQDTVCGIHPDTVIPVASAPRVAAALLRLAELPSSAFGHSRAMNLPSLSVTARALAVAAGSAAGPGAGRVAWLPDPALQAVIDGWPRRFVSDRAAALGLSADADAEEIVRHFLRDIGRA